MRLLIVATPLAVEDKAHQAHAQRQRDHSAEDQRNVAMLAHLHVGEFAQSPPGDPDGGGKKAQKRDNEHDGSTQTR